MGFSVLGCSEDACFDDGLDASAMDESAATLDWKTGFASVGWLAALGLPGPPRLMVLDRGGTDGIHEAGTPSKVLPRRRDLGTSLPATEGW